MIDVSIDTAASLSVISSMGVCEAGGYLGLLLHAALDPRLGLPDDDYQLAKLSRLDGSWFEKPAGSALTRGERIREQFVIRDGRLFDLASVEREKQRAERRKANAAGGIQSGRVRRERREKEQQKRAETIEKRSPLHFDSTAVIANTSEQTEVFHSSSALRNDRQTDSTAITRKKSQSVCHEKTSAADEQITAAIPQELHRRLGQVPSHALLVRIRQNLRGAPVEHFAQRILQRQRVITSLGILAHFAADVGEIWERSAPEREAAVRKQCEIAARHRADVERAEREIAEWERAADAWRALDAAAKAGYLQRAKAHLRTEPRWAWIDPGIRESEAERYASMLFQRAATEQRISA